MMNWIETIAIMILVKQDMEKYDEEGLWEYHLPEVAASEELLIKTEQHLGYHLDSEYKEFLKYANGWKSFYQSVDLFGTNELVSSSDMDYAVNILNAIEDSVIFECGVPRDELLPIAVTKIDKDLFVITKLNSSNPGQVIWFAGEEIDRFDNFKEFFLSMIDYNREELKYFKDLNG
ncbi:SMI1/KNR4 family protein [Paenibacillus lentus]|uniref:SMI1/KNR4 family protein n=1 Tax=Paenibacillus lentus TaxID=1338368 RepID=A0A3Q8S3C7_9BACL|nr:SMI1/KNR4 family protein [Paenibacillus lentus]AZK44862.1 SMI1/KNR4 family protein [Paenibacillus lentus]